MRPAERYAITCTSFANPFQPRQLVEQVNEDQLFAVLMHHCQEPWDSICVTRSARVYTATGHEILAGGRLQ